jgi:hypothetical protein
VGVHRKLKVGFLAVWTKSRGRTSISTALAHEASKDSLKLMRKSILSIAKACALFDFALFGALSGRDHNRVGTSIHLCKAATTYSRCADLKADVTLLFTGFESIPLQFRKNHLKRDAR